MSDRARPAGVAAIDIGGTKIAGAVLLTDDSLSDVLRVPTPRTTEGILDAVERLISTLRRQHPIGGVGIGAAGVIDREGTVRSATAILPGWQGTHLASDQAARAGVPVVAVNDVHAAAVGEAAFGACRGATSALVVALGTGVGGALVHGGTLVHGTTGVAGSIGHVSVRGVDARCSCGQIGHLEAAASGPAMEQRYRDLTGADLRLVEIAARVPHDDVAASVIHDAGVALGEALASAVNLVDVETVVVGGGAAQVGDPLLRPARRTFAAAVLRPAAEVPIVPANLGPNAALWGAAALARGVLS